MKNSIVPFFLATILLLGSCNSQPSDQDIKDQIGLYYMGISKAAGGGSWQTKKINILKKSLVKDEKGIWLITAETKGIYESPPLGNPVPDKAFCDTLSFRFWKNEFDKWVGELNF